MPLIKFEILPVHVAFPGGWSKVYIWSPLEGSRHPPRFAVGRGFYVPEFN